MTTQISGDTGVSAVQSGVVSQGDLAANVVGNGPAFSAYASAGTSCANNTDTKVSMGAEAFNTSGTYDTAQSRWMPGVAGYYSITVGAALSGGGTTMIAVLYKNGTRIHYGAGGVLGRASSTFLVYLGTTDYVEPWVYNAAGSAVSTTPGLENTYFQGYLVRAA